MEQGQNEVGSKGIVDSDVRGDGMTEALGDAESMTRIDEKM